MHFPIPNPIWLPFFRFSLSCSLSSIRFMVLAGSLICCLFECVLSVLRALDI